MLIKKYVKITIKDKTSTLDEELYFYKNDKNIDVMFELINFKFDFIKNQSVTENLIEQTNPSYATLRIIKPSQIIDNQEVEGEKILVTRCPIESGYIRFVVTPEFIDELDEVGIHKLQISLYDEFEGRISIPPITFEVLQPLFDEESEEDESNNIIGNTNISKIEYPEETINETNGRTPITEGEELDLYEWQYGDWISDIRLNAIQKNIIKLKEPKPSTDVLYGKNGLNTVQDALDVLLSPTLAINSFNINVSTFMEIGITVNRCDFTWSYNKDKIVSQLINDIRLDTNVRQYRYATPFNTTKTFTLISSDGMKEVEKSITVQFCNRIFYGTSVPPQIYNNTFLNSLNSELFPSRNKTIQVNATEGQYIYYIIPSKYGECVMSVNGFIGGFSKITTISYTNTYNYTENYDVYISDNLNLGNTTVVIQ